MSGLAELVSQAMTLHCCHRKILWFETIELGKVFNIKCFSCNSLRGKSDLLIMFLCLKTILYNVHNVTNCEDLCDEVL